MPRIGNLAAKQLDVFLNGLYPWTWSLHPAQPAKSNTGFDTITISAVALNCFYLTSSGAQNDQVIWDIVLPAGTWEISLIHYSATAQGIYSLYLDTTLIGTVDGYANPGGPNQIDTVQNIVVAETKKYAFKLKLATKNAASSGYYGTIHLICFRRTA